MKFSETEGTGISNSNHKSGKLIYLLLMMLIGSIQTSFANNLHLHTNQDELLVIVDLSDKDNLFFNGLITDGFLEAIQTNLNSIDSNSDGTGVQSNSDGTGSPNSNSDGTGSPNSNSDGTGLQVLSVLLSCNNKIKSTGIIESDSGNETVVFDQVNLNGEKYNCK